MNKSYYDKTRQQITFNIGDKCLLRDESRKVGRSPKLSPKYRGPFTVTHIYSPVVYRLQLSPTKTDTFHVSKMKRFYEQKHSGMSKPSDKVQDFGSDPVTTDQISVDNDSPTPSTSHRYKTRSKSVKQLGRILEQHRGTLHLMHQN